MRASNPKNGNIVANLALCIYEAPKGLEKSKDVQEWLARGYYLYTADVNPITRKIVQIGATPKGVKAPLNNEDFHYFIASAREFISIPWVQNPGL